MNGETTSKLGKEDEIIVRIARSPNVTQRELASQTGISLGMTNIILKRLVRKGFLKISRLNSRNIRYVLTPEGFAEYTRRSYDYLAGTISSVKQLKLRIKHVVKSEIEKGAPGFVIHGEGELADITELALRDVSAELGTKWARGANQDGWTCLVCNGNGEVLAGAANPDALGSGGGTLDLDRAIVEMES